MNSIAVTRMTEALVASQAFLAANPGVPIDPRSVPALLADLAEAGVAGARADGKLKSLAAQGFPAGVREELTRRKEELRAWLKFFSDDGGAAYRFSQDADTGPVGTTG